MTRGPTLAFFLQLALRNPKKKIFFLLQIATSTQPWSCRRPSAMHMWHFSTLVFMGAWRRKRSVVNLHRQFLRLAVVS